MRSSVTTEEPDPVVVVPGDIIGAPGIMIGDRHIESAVALSNVSVCVIPRDTFLELIHNHPEIIARAMQRRSKRSD